MTSTGPSPGSTDTVNARFDDETPYPHAKQAAVSPRPKISDIVDARFAALTTNKTPRRPATGSPGSKTPSKIDAKFAQVDARFAAQDAKIDARFGRLEDAVGEINVNLAALIDHLDQTEEVEAAVEGRFEDTAGPQGAVG